MQALLKQYPQAKWHQWESAVSDGAREGGKLAFGRYVNTVYRPERAEVILSLDSDFLASGPGHIRYMKAFYKRRKLEQDPQVEQLSSEMNRLYVVEPTPSVTGSSADHRLPLRASEIEQFARALAAKLGLGGSGTLSPAAQKWLDVVAKDLQGHRGSSLVIAGEQQSAEVHALAHAINAALSNPGNTLYYTEPVEANPVNQLESLRELCADMDAGKVDTLLILGGNPVYDTPHDFDFASKLRKVRNAVQLSPVLRRDLATLPLARRGIALPGSLGRRSRFRWHRQRDSAVDRAALRHAFRARCAGGVQRQAGRQRVRRDPRPSEDRGRQQRLREILAQDAERRRGGELGVPAAQSLARSSILAACPRRSLFSRKNSSLFSARIPAFTTGDLPTTAGCRNCRNRSPN